MDQNMLSEEALDHLLSRTSRSAPVNRAALDDERVSAALDGVWSRIESGAPREATSRSTGRRVCRRRLAGLGFAAVAVGVASLVGVETLTGGAGSSGLPLAVSPAAAAVLDKVAHAAAAQTGPTVGQWDYVKTETIGRESIRAGGTTINYTITYSTQTWYAPTGGTRMRTTNDGGSFATPQDKANYETNKSAIDKRFGGHFPTAATGAADDVVDPNRNGPPHVWQTSPPSAPQTLLSEISASEPAYLRGKDPSMVWGDLLQVLLTSTSPQARSTAFAALSYLPGTKVLGVETNALGRSGTAISFTDPSSTDRSGDVLTVIVSPRNGEILASDETLRRPYHGLPAGTVVSRETFVQQGVVGSDDALPAGGTQPLPNGLTPISSGPPSATSTTPTAPYTSTAPETRTAAR